MVRDLSIADIKAMLLDRVEDLARELVPDGQVKGARWIARNPTRSDNKTMGNFIVGLSGQHQGGWIDFGTDDKGDVIDLIAYVLFGAVAPPSRDARIQAIQWAKAWLGLEGMSREEFIASKREASARKAENDAKAERDRRAKYERALAIWGAAGPMRDSAADLYLQSRGIDARGIANLEHSLRFHPRLEHLLGEPHVGPAMVAKMVDAQGVFSAIHVTYVRADGSDKADVNLAKVTLGGCKGAMIRLTRGCTGTTPEEAAVEGERGPCVLTEGIEDGLSVAMATPELRIWAAWSLGNLQQAHALPCVNSWIVCADNDWGKPQALALLERSVEILRGTGRPVEVCRSSSGKDFNDLLRGK